MKTVTVVSEGGNHSAVDLGRFADLPEYSYRHPKRNAVVQGKQFLGEALKATGAEVSFQLLPPGHAHPFFHQHSKHEEIYVILQGSGQFQVDESVFDVTEGSVIRVAPEGRRIYRNNSDAPLVFMCIQCMAGSLDSFFVEDGRRAEGKAAWEER